MKIRNLTPHTVGFYQGGELVYGFVSEGQVRLTEIDQNHGFVVVDGMKIPTCDRIYGDGTLPSQQDDTILIVSGIVCEAFPTRRDLYFPAFDVRDKDGKFIGTTTLCQVPRP